MSDDGSSSNDLELCFAGDNNASSFRLLELPKELLELVSGENPKVTR
jgi:hypothetical protein